MTRRTQLFPALRAVKTSIAVVLKTTFTAILSAHRRATQKPYLTWADIPHWDTRPYPTWDDVENEWHTPLSVSESQNLRFFAFGPDQFALVKALSCQVPRRPALPTGQPKNPPRVGARYVKANVVRRDTLAGFFEELNSPLTSRSEAHVQRALLTQPPAPSGFLESLCAIGRYMLQEKP